MSSNIMITIDDGPAEGFYLEHFDDLLTRVKRVCKNALLDSYTVDSNPDPELSPPTKEDIADYKAYHKMEGIHSQ